MLWPIVIHKDKASDYGVTVPDLPGCFSAGRTLEEAIAAAKEAIELHLEGLMEEGLGLPEPSSMERWRDHADFADGTWALVPACPGQGGKSVRVNITLPARILETVDRFAQSEGETRSGLLARAALGFIQSHRPAAKHLRRSKGGQGQKRSKVKVS